jgi:molybdenum cofactor cytidylyltransferase
MGSQKLLLPLGGRPLVQWAVDAALASAASETVVVVGHEGAAVAAALDERRVRLVINTAFTGGMSTSLKVGIEAVRERCDAAVVLHADQPFVTSALIDALIERHSATGALVVRPAVGGRPATPVLLGAPLFPELLEQEGDVGGREVVARHQHEVSLVTVDDARLLADIDTIEQYEAAREML